MASIVFEANPVWVPGDETVEVRALSDNADILSQIEKESIGLYPPLFFAQEALLDGGTLTLGLCQCGCEGCGDIVVEVLPQGDHIMWSSVRGDSRQWAFDVQSYKQAVATAAADLSWERTEDTIKRLLYTLDFSAALKHGLTFKSGYVLSDASGVELHFTDDHGIWQSRTITCPTYEPELAIAAVQAYLAEAF